jgi:hypothetical protein
MTMGTSSIPFVQYKVGMNAGSDNVLVVIFYNQPKIEESEL